MTETSQTVLQLPTKTVLASTDKVVVVANVASGGNVATIEIGKLFSGYAGSQSAGAVGYTGSVGYVGSQGDTGYTGSAGGSGISGTFTTVDNKIVTVTDGIITGIENV